MKVSGSSLLLLFGLALGAACYFAAALSIGARITKLENSKHTTHEMIFSRIDSLEIRVEKLEHKP